MAIESPGIATQADEHVHLDDDSHLNYTVFELKDIVAGDDAALESNFETKEADDVALEIAVAHYESMLSHQEAFVGIGNSALVFKQNPEAERSERCVKCRWDFLMVNNKSKKLSNLPANLQRLKAVDNHFAKVNEKTRVFREKGLEMVPDNGVLREALVQHMASQIMDEAGYIGRIPDVDFIVKIEREESGDVDGDPFSAAETVQLMFMEQVQGVTLEEVMRNPSAEIAHALDTDIFEKELRDMVAILHEHGILHKDLSIRNIMLGSSDLRPHIIDFGKSTYSSHLTDGDKEADLVSVEEAVRYMKRFKADPQKTLESLKEIQTY